MKKAFFCKGWGGSGKGVASLFPGWELEVVSPQPNLMDRVKASEASLLIGYSTGAFLLLHNESLWERFERVVLFAPFEDFKKESGRGGRIPEAQIKYLMRWLKKDPLAALGDFYGRAGLDLGAPEELPYPLDDLCWGLERLLLDSAQGDALSRVEAYVGVDDTLLDAAVLKSLYPNINVVPGAGHGLAGLLRESGCAL